MTSCRSWLFVPADSEKKITKALDSEADAIIFDLEDSVSPPLKPVARDLLKTLPKRSGGPQWWVRVNPLASEYHKEDLELLGVADIHGIVLPKAESGADVTQLSHRTGNIPVHAIVTETPASLFGLLSYRQPGSPLAAMSWGAEDLSAALGASSKTDENGELRQPRASSRSMACSPTSRTNRACNARPRRRAAKASPASSPSTRRKCRSSMPPSLRRTTRCATRKRSSRRSRRIRTRACFRSGARWSTART
jgi:HpcH/HpaI aldolase/citrate lyase family